MVGFRAYGLGFRVFSLGLRYVGEEEVIRSWGLVLWV